MNRPAWMSIGGLIEDRGHHLRRDEALPDQSIKFQLFRFEILRE
jgi:hypothetical protein